MIPWLRQCAAASPQHVALVVEGRAISYAELESGVRATAVRLREAGLRRGDVLATLLWNGRALVECLHATALCGATLLPLNARSEPSELAFILRDGAARLLVHGADTLEANAQQAARRAGSLRMLAVTGGPGESLARDAVPAGAGADPVNEVTPESPLAILYTSGTTGRPKGACLSFRNFLASAVASAHHLGASSYDRWLACLPLFHVGGLAILVRSVLVGSAVVVHERFDAEAVSEALDRESITHVSLVPTMLRRVLEARGGQSAPPTLRCVLVGGGPAAPALLDRARALGFPVAATYGLTEATSQVATQSPGAPSPGGGGFAQPLPGIEVRIEAEDGSVLGAGEEGEICVRGPTVMTGYLGRPEDTARALRGGWLHTGDVGTLDARGWLRVLDRRHDLVVSGGENVYPAEVEAVLESHPDVAEAAVTGEPDVDLGQRIVAAVVLCAGARCDAEALRGFCRTRLAGYKVPRRLLFVADLPRTSSGKVLRGELAVGAEPDLRRATNGR